MRKLICVTLVLLLSCGFAFADLDNEITIEVQSGIAGSWTQYGGSVSSYRDWRFYHGFTQITEPQFLELTGYPDKAEAAEKHHKVEEGLIAATIIIATASLVPTGLGLYLSSEAANYSIYDDAYWRYYEGSVTSFIFASVFASATIIPAIIMLTRQRNLLPLELAAKIAEEYNASLNNR